MPLDVGLNFRANSGYVTDGANETYALADAYPTTRGGITFGWENVGTSSPQSRDRNSAIDRRLAGIVFTTALGGTFRIDLPNTGTYQIHCALGDPEGSGIASYYVIKDNASAIATISGATNNWVDATGATRSSANWPANEVSIQATFASTILRFSANSGVTDAIGHIRVVEIVSGNPHSYYAQQQ